MLTIFPKESQTFSSLGLGVISPSACTVTEELNGGYELALSHPYDRQEKWKRLDMERIILAPTPKGRQPFRIYSVNPTMDGLEVKARHLFYDLLDNLCLHVSASNVTAQEALNAIKAAMVYDAPFTFSTDMTITGSVSGDNQNPVSLLLSDDEDIQSFVGQFGGELSRDGYEITLTASLGADRGVTIAYRKNLVGLEVTEDLTDTATRVYPIGKDGLRLAGSGYVDSPYIDAYAYPKIRVLEDSGAENQAQLAALAADFYAAGGDLPLINIKVSFQDLAQTAEYAHFVQLEQVFLGDVVTVYNPKMGFSKKAKVISYEYDCLMERYDSIELGDFSPSITTAITSGAQSGAVAMGASTEAKQIYSLISGICSIGVDGLTICVDGNTPESSQKRFHFGQQGLRYTSNGGGSWITLIDQNGQIQS